IQQDEYKAALQSARAQLAKAQADLARAKDVAVVDRAQGPGAGGEGGAGEGPGGRGPDPAPPRPQAGSPPGPGPPPSDARAVAGVEGAEAALKDTVINQRTAIQLAEAAVEAGKAAVIQADLNLKYTTIESPISGIISKLSVDQGNLVGKADATTLATVSAVD